MHIRAALFFAVIAAAVAAGLSLAGSGVWTPSRDLARVNAVALAIDPERPSTIYAATYQSGVFKSTDGGRRWRSAGVGQGVRSLAIDPSSPSTVYAGTWRRGIFKTTNAGATWDFLRLPHNDMGVLALVVDPEHPETVYAGTESVGVFKTVDGGATWSETNATIGRRMILSLSIDPKSPQTLYAATFREGYSHGSIFKTTNGGKNWRELKRENLATGEKVAVDPRRPSTLYAILDHRLYMSTDGGATWSLGAPRRGDTQAPSPCIPIRRTSISACGLTGERSGQNPNLRAPSSAASTEEVRGIRSEADLKFPADRSRGQRRRP